MPSLLVADLSLEAFGVVLAEGTEVVASSGSNSLLFRRDDSPRPLRDTPFQNLLTRIGTDHHWD